MLSGDVSLEIVEVQDRRIRLISSSSSQAWSRLHELRERGGLDHLLDFVAAAVKRDAGGRRGESRLGWPGHDQRQAIDRTLVDESLGYVNLVCANLRRADRGNADLSVTILDISG